MVGEWYCEEQFIVFTSVEGGRNEIHAEFFGHYRGLVVDRYAVLVYPASRVACPAYMEQFARQAVGNIHHGCGLYAGAGECGDYVAAGFGFQLSFDKILLSVKFRYEVFFSGRCYFFRVRAVAGPCMPHRGRRLRK